VDGQRPAKVEGDVQREVAARHCAPVSHDGADPARDAPRVL
jgi:hypothetical protein